MNTNDFPNIRVNQVGDFWVVTKPNEKSTIDDILFLSDPIHFANQIRGGLDETKVYGFYTSYDFAHRHAHNLLNAKNKNS